MAQLESTNKIIEYASHHFNRFVDNWGNLGSGSFGSVCLAKHESLGVVAVKCIPFTGGRHETNQLKKKIQNELYALHQANHRNIVRVHGWTQWTRTVGLIMEYLPGGNLWMLVVSEISVEPGLWLQMSVDISSGLAYIHNINPKKRLAHGDIKPENVLLDHNLVCKIADFGSAQLCSYTGSSSATGSDSRAREMTRVYAAPERLKGEVMRVRREQDTYSYGLMTYVMLTGQRLCESADEDIFIENVKQGRRPDMQEIEDIIGGLASNQDREIVKLLQNKIIQCWNHDRNQRPEMTDVRDDLLSLMKKLDKSTIKKHAVEVVTRMEIDVPDQSLASLPLNEVFASRIDTGVTLQQMNQGNRAENRTDQGTGTRSMEGIAEGIGNVNVQSGIDPLLRRTDWRNKDEDGKFQTLTAMFPDNAPTKDVIKIKVEEFSSNWLKEEYKEADELLDQIAHAIDTLSKATASEMDIFAKQKLRESKFAEAFLFYQILAKIHLAKPKIDFIGVRNCLWDLHDTSEEAIRSNGSNVRQIDEYVIPKMQAIWSDLHQTESDDRRVKCESEAWCLHYIDCCLKMVGRHNDRIVTLRQTLDLLNEGLGNVAKKHQLYSVCEENINFLEKQNSSGS